MIVIVKWKRIGCFLKYSYVNSNIAEIKCYMGDSTQINYFYHSDEEKISHARSFLSFVTRH